MESHFEFEFEFELRLRLRTHGSRPLSSVLLSVFELRYNPQSVSKYADVLKPIFHCDAKYLASGVGVEQCTRRQNFVLPNAKYTNMLVYFALGDAHFPTRNLKVAFYPTRNPNASQWNIGCVGSLALGLCVGYVHFTFFVLISSTLGSRRKCSFQWNMGFKSWSWHHHYIPSVIFFLPVQI